MDTTFVSAVIVAAGSSIRMGRPKQLIPLCGRPVLSHTLCAFDRSSVDELIVVVRAADMPQIEPLTQGLCKPCRLVAGGQTRQQSVSNGLSAVSSSATHIAVADGARPLVTAEIIDRVIQTAEKTGAAAAAVPVKDTIKQADANGVVTATPDRAALWQVQTPQVFALPLYRRAMAAATAQGLDLTDDCQLIEHIGESVTLVKADYRNIKITTPEDVVTAEAILRERGTGGMRIGHGYDVHRLVEDRALILGGVSVPHEKGLLGHSDADVLTHAVADALLGAAALGDIGTWFPDTDARYAGANSLLLLREVVRLVQKEGFSIGNIDVTVLAQRPKLKPFIGKMRENLAAACGVPVEQVSVKATTEEGLGFTGEERGIAAHAVCLLL